MEFKDLEIPPDLAVSLERQRQQHETSLLSKAIIGVITIALGVYIGNFLYTKYVIYEAGKALEQFNAQMAAETRQMQARMAEKAERERQYQLALEQERTRQKQMELDFRQRQIDTQLAAQEEARRKEAAWDKHYKKPAMCVNASRQSVMVECGNDYIRARQKFEASWAMKPASN